MVDSFTERCQYVFSTKKSFLQKLLIQAMTSSLKFTMIALNCNSDIANFWWSMTLDHLLFWVLSHKDLSFMCIWNELSNHQFVLDTCLPTRVLSMVRKMVKHWMLQIDKALSMDMTGVTQIFGHTYKVLLYQTYPTGRLYNVFLCDDETLPSCSCDYWPSSLYLCKHFFAVMRKFSDEVQWSSLSTLYRESPFFSLDPID